MGVASGRSGFVRGGGMGLVVTGRSLPLCHNVMYLLNHARRHASGARKKAWREGQARVLVDLSAETGEGWDLQLDQAAIWKGL